jgi:uncharacterized protein YjiK
MSCFLACSQRPLAESPGGYDFTTPEIVKLPGVLNEISGICFNNGDGNTIYAQQDEEGKIFYFPPSATAVKNIQFGKKGDYEDITISNENVYVLRSDGTIFSTKLNIPLADKATSVEEIGGLVPKAEYEAMYATGNKLYLLCKSCREDNPTKAVTGYILNTTPVGTPTLEASFQVNSRDVAALLGDKKLVFRPSAMAFNSASREWYILSSVNKALVLTDDQWKVKAAYKLDAQLFPQPEGLAFDNAGALYISNERGPLAAATILKFAFKQDKK